MPHLLQLPPDRIPAQIQQALDEQIKTNGRIDLDRLDPVLQQELMRVMKDYAEESNDDSEMQMRKEVMQTVNAVIADLEYLGEITGDLFTAFHDKGINVDVVKAYNACTQFIAKYNTVELEHGKCLQDVLRS